MTRDEQRNACIEAMKDAKVMTDRDHWIAFKWFWLGFTMAGFEVLLSLSLTGHLI